MADPTPTEPRPDSPSTRALLAAGVAITLVHLVLVWHACPSDVVFSGEPAMGIDYQTHFEQVRIIHETLDRFGKTWAYDPNLLAGQPAGLFFDVDNKLHCYSSYILTKLGVGQATAFNLFVVAVHLVAPFCVLVAALLFCLRGRAALFAFGLAVLIWHFDSASRWYWWAGMISFALCAHLAMVTLGLFFRLMRDGRWRFWAGAMVTLPLALSAHVWAFAILVVPMVGLYIRHFRQQGAVGHARVWSLALFSLGVNLIWLHPALWRLDLIAPSGRGGQASPLTLITDYLEIYIDGLIAGTIAPRTMFRFLALCGAGLTLWRWRKGNDHRLFVGALTLGWALSMAYLFALVPFIEETEPYRFILPATLWAVVLCAPWLDRVVRRDWIRPLPRRAKAVMVVLLVLLVPRALQTAFYFTPEVLPLQTSPSIPRPNIEGPTALVPIDPFFSFRLNKIPKDYKDMARFITEECGEDGRVLVEWWVLAEYLRWATDKPIIGGFPDRRMKHEAANIFRYKEDPRHKGQALADYLVRYNIRYMVVSTVRADMEKRRDLFEFKRFVGAHRVYRVRHLGNYFLAGSGEVSADLNRIDVTNAKPAPNSQKLVLRFHHLDTLRCTPDCRVARYPLPDNPIGFIQVEGQPTLPSRFSVVNGY